MFGLWERKGKSGEPLPEANDGPPDSQRPSGLCPRCDKQSSFETTGRLPITFDGGTAYPPNGQPHATFDERATGFICRHCRQGFVVVESEWVGDSPRRSNPKHGGTLTWRGHHWWPVPGAVLHDSVPAPVRSAFDEACKCLASDCPRAGTAMARCALEGIVVDQGETKGLLVQRLKNLADNRNALLHSNMIPDVNETARLFRSDRKNPTPEQIKIDLPSVRQIADDFQKVLGFWVGARELYRSRNKRGRQISRIARLPRLARTAAVSFLA